MEQKCTLEKLIKILNKIIKAMGYGRIAIISPELRGNKVTFLLTAYKTRKK